MSVDAPKKRRFKYVNTFVDRHGNQRSYFRYAGITRSLRGTIGSAGWLREYHDALAGVPVAAPRPTKKEQVEQSTDDPPKIGVYLLLLDGEMVYVGSSLNMRKRVAAHRTNGRPFDQAFYIGTMPTERIALERALIVALGPRQAGRRIRR